MNILKLIGTLFILSVLSCATTELRKPAQVEVPYSDGNGHSTKSYYEVFFTAEINVSKKELSEAEFANYRQQCHIQLVENILEMTPNLRNLKNYSGKNLRISNLYKAKDPLSLLNFDGSVKYFTFTLEGSDGNKYSGHVYRRMGNREVVTLGDVGQPVYKCSLDNNGAVYDAVQIKDQHGTVVLSSSSAVRMFNGEKIDERGNHSDSVYKYK